MIYLKLSMINKKTQLKLSLKIMDTNWIILTTLLQKLKSVPKNKKTIKNPFYLVTLKPRRVKKKRLYNP